MKEGHYYAKPNIIGVMTPTYDPREMRTARNGDFSSFYRNGMEVPTPHNIQHLPTPHNLQHQVINRPNPEIGRRNVPPRPQGFSNYYEANYNISETKEEEEDQQQTYSPNYFQPKF
jgi:hypothetical protein